MKRVLNLIILSLLTLSFAACDDLTGGVTRSQVNDPDFSVGGVDAVELDGQRFRFSGTANSGGDSAHHFKARFFLPESERVTFIFFASRGLNNGVHISFEREGGKIYMDIQANGLGHNLRLKSLEEKYPVNKALDLEFDIHNDHEDLHSLVWEAGGPRGDRFGCTVDSDFFDENQRACLYNSEDFAFDVWLGVGRLPGAFWGMEGDPSLIRNVSGPLRKLSDA